MDRGTSEDVNEEYKVLKGMIYNTVVGESKAINAVGTLEKLKNKVTNKNQIGFLINNLKSTKI